MKKSKIFISGHKGLVGSAVHELLKKKYNVIIVDKKELDLRNENKVDSFFKSNKFDYVINCAAVVGGIKKNNNFPYDMLYENLKIQNNIITSSFIYKVKRLIFLGSSCIYPKKTKNPIKEDQLLTGTLEKTNESYAISKIAGIKLCEALYKQYNFFSICVMPTNVYGLNDKFDPENGHVVPAIFSKIYKAKKLKKKKLSLLGTGRPIREFIYSEDLAEAIYSLITISKKKIVNICKKKYPIFNVGTGHSVTIRKLASIIKKIANYEGIIKFQSKKWNGTFCKNLNSEKMHKIGWKSKVSLEQGLNIVNQNFLIKK
jgi:GDP-L-fucose synthase